MRRTSEPYDLVGIGLGPFNLGLAALADELGGVRALFCERKPAFSWHPGMLLDGTTLQVPFLADLVSLVEPTSRWSFLAYLRDHDRLFPFYFLERFHVPRREYDHYCRWVAESLPSCRFGAAVEALERDGEGFAATLAGGERIRARNVVLGVGTEPAIPEPLRALGPERAFHVADYAERRGELRTARDITVIGSGQSGAEVLLDLLDGQREHGYRLRWLTRTRAFAPMEYSKLGLEQFTPDYVEYFHGLPEPERDRLVPDQWQLHKAIDADTIAAIYDRLYERSVAGERADVRLTPNVEVTAARAADGAVELRCRERSQGREVALRAERVVLATGYEAVRPPFLDPDLVDWDERGRYRIDAEYRVALRSGDGLYVQNGELHTHGVGAPDLGLGAYRSAVILRAITGRTVGRIPRDVAFTSFGAPRG